jgi:hypothetical protein
MVACASPHWGPGWLGGTITSDDTIVKNCVTRNAWAVKQLIQTQPALLIIVGQPSYEMFSAAFGKWIRSTPRLPTKPVDGAFTLLRQTADPKTPTYVEFAYSSGGRKYALKTRLVVSPHFSYESNFYPQFRLSPSQDRAFRKSFASCVDFLTHSADVTCLPPANKADYVAFELVKNAKGTFAALKRKYPDALKGTDAWIHLRERHAVRRHGRHVREEGALLDEGEQGRLPLAQRRLLSVLRQQPLGVPTRVPLRQSP